ncbi:unnamed protein product [Caenorhabditis nigoni]
MDRWPWFFMTAIFNKDGMIGRDGKTFRLDRVYTLLGKTQAPNLANKPKLVFVDTLSLSRSTNNELADDEDSDTPMEDEADGDGSSNHPAYGFEDEADGDFLMSFSSPNYYYSYSHPSYGSTFIRCICQSMARMAHNHHIEDIMMQVKSMVARIERQKGQSTISQRIIRHDPSRQHARTNGEPQLKQAQNHQISRPLPSTSDQIQNPSQVVPNAQGTVDPAASTQPSHAAENPEEESYRITGVRATETMAPAHGSSQLRYMFNEKELVSRTKNIDFKPMTMYPISCPTRLFCLVLSVTPLRDGSSVRGLHPSIMVPHSQGTVDSAPSLLPRPIAVAAQVRTDASLMEIQLTEAVAPSDQSNTHHPATSAPPPTAANPEETIWRVTGVRATETVAPAHGSSQLRYKFNEKDLVMRTKNIVFQPRTMYPMSSQHRPYCLVLSVKPLRDGRCLRGADATNNNIHGVFEKLGFRVIFVVDPTAEVGYHLKLSERAFNTNEIIGSDGQPFNVDHIFRLLGTAHSPNLANKPKLLFLDTVGPFSCRQWTNQNSESAVAVNQREDVDFCIMRSSSNHGHSFRSPTYGSVLHFQLCKGAVRTTTPTIPATTIRTRGEEDRRKFKHRSQESEMCLESNKHIKGQGSEAHKALVQKSQIKTGKLSALKILVNNETLNPPALQNVLVPPNAGNQIPSGQDNRVETNPPALLTVQVQPNQTPGRIPNVQDGRVAASEPTPAAVQSGPNVMGAQRRENRQMPIRTPAAHLPIDSLQGYKFQDKDLVMRTKEIAYQPITMYPISSENHPYCLVLCLKTLRDGSNLKGAEENILNIRGVFGELGFRIFVVLDPTAKKIATKLAQLGKWSEHGAMAAVFLTGIFNRDGMTVYPPALRTVHAPPNVTGGIPNVPTPADVQVRPNATNSHPTEDRQMAVRAPETPAPMNSHQGYMFHDTDLVTRTKKIDFHPKQMYEMSSKYIPYCLVLCMKTLRDGSILKGAEENITNIQGLFKKLEFRVGVVVDPTAKEIATKLAELGKRPDRGAMKYMFRDEDLVIRTKDIAYQPITMYPISSENRPYCLLLRLKTLRDGSSLKGVDENFTNIRGLFQNLGFRVGIVVDPTATKIEAVLANLGRRQDHGSMAMVFMTGVFNLDGVTGRDGKEQSFEKKNELLLRQN